MIKTKRSIKDVVFEKMTELKIASIEVLFNGGNDSGDVEGIEINMEPGVPSLKKEDNPFVLNEDVLDLRYQLSRIRANDVSDFTMFENLFSSVREMNTAQSLNESYDEWFFKYAVIADYLEDKGTGETATELAAQIRENLEDYLLSTIIEEPIYMKYGTFAGEFDVHGTLTWDNKDKTVAIKGHESVTEWSSVEEDF
mgnify:CR=1 FL=1